MGRTMRRSKPSRTLIAWLALCSLWACAPGGPGPSGEPSTGGPNQYKSTWGRYRGPNGIEYYISDSHFGFGSSKELYDIQSASASSIVARYTGTSFMPENIKTVTLTRLGDAAFTCSPVSSSSGKVTDKPFAIALIVGTEAEASGTAMKPEGSRALVQAAGISLVLRNVLNGSDIHPVTTDNSGAFSTTELIPGDSYAVTQSTGESLGTVAVPENEADLGIVTKPVGSYSIVCELESAGIDAQNTLQYCYAGQEAFINARVSFNGTGTTGWAAWNFTRDGVVIPRGYGGTAVSDYFSLPTDGGYASSLITAKLPATFVKLTDIPSGKDRIDVPLGVKGAGTSGNIFAYEDRVTVRFYKSSLTLGTDGDSGIGQDISATLITPDLRVHSLELGAFPVNSTIPRMIGRYYIIIMGKGSYRLGPELAFTGTEDPAPDLIETAGDEPNYSRSLAKRILPGQTYQGVVGPLDTYGNNLDPVDYLYFDLVAAP